MGYVLNLRQKVGQQPLIVVGSAAIVRRQQQVLLVKRRDNHLWGLPAGSKELNEDTAATAERELREETGLQGIVQQLLAVVSGQDMQYTYPNGDQIDSVTVVYDVAATGNLEVTTDETSAAKFFDLAQLPEQLTPLTKKILTTLKLI
ncbi:ADP-ribose pyrophosphatase [Levilactobacillus koreensis JCM 16448]|uniref:Phosphohydrolase n=1 Tax=Levilactobacillus koreensis TaxID=637971 RepID=A0AAC8ZHD3_9LACO|nr:NUDIX domain-containing protein [Levilactobacillus koreensis]AKP65745.1 phosphohydrolase [Levilactobacillus koreensis]KRK85846.1 ADP-ribose pyrophosphatase [Levilactobacillus koreensis JCM 16448]